jgi:predicted dehydrogenase
VAIVGLRGRGRDHIHEFAAISGVEIATLCDVDETVLTNRLDDAERLTGKRPAGQTDYRNVVDDKSVDVVVIATPDHWHTLQTIWACQAGKDVLVEKPCTHNIFECRQIVAAARKYGRIVQHGTQSRSSAVVCEAVRRLREGIIGDVYMARALCFNPRDTIGRAGVEPVPKQVHYDLWVGPAPMRPFSRNRFHYNWHWQWDYGCGDIGNQGVHEIDVARWGLGVTYPTRVSAIGGHVMFDDDQETPNVLNAAFEFSGAKKKLLVAEVRHWLTNKEAGIGEPRKDCIGDIFYGSNGYLTRGPSGCTAYIGKERAEVSMLPADGEHSGHAANFIQAVRSRRVAALNADIEEGAITCTLVHLANLSYRLGRTLDFDPKSLECVGDAEANAMFTTAYRVPYVVPAQV